MVADRLVEDTGPPKLEEIRCTGCRRALTNPESRARGAGAYCYRKIVGDAELRHRERVRDVDRRMIPFEFLRRSLHDRLTVVLLRRCLALAEARLCP